jgi:hypothetical protein
MVYAAENLRFVKRPAAQTAASGGKSLHPRFVTCLLVSALAAVIAAAYVGIAAGAGWPLVLLTYSGTGSLVLIVLATLVRPGDAPRPRPLLLPPPAAPARQNTRAIA